MPVHLELELDGPLKRGLLHVGDVDDVHGDVDGGGAVVLGHGREAGEVLTGGRELDEVAASLVSLVLALRLAVTHAGHGQTRAVRTRELGVIAAENALLNSAIISVYSKSHFYIKESLL